MKKLLIALVLTATTATASNTNVKFVTTDNSTETNLCLSAAKYGWKSALRKSHKKLNYDIICNGQSIKSFSKNYNVEPKKINDDVTTQFLVIPANDNSASKVCAQAVRSGIDSVKNTVDFNVKDVTCNGKSISKFVKEYKNT